MQHSEKLFCQGLVVGLVLTTYLAASAQDPFQQLPPGSFPYGQYQGNQPGSQPSNGAYPQSGFGRGPAIPAQPTAGARPNTWPGAPDGAVQATFNQPSGPGPAPRRGQICEWAQTLGRVGDDVVLTGDLLNSIDDMMKRAESRIPPDKRAEQRAMLVKEVTDGIHEFAEHVAAGDPDPAKGVSDSHRLIMYQIVRQQMDIKLIYLDFRKTNPKEMLGHVQEMVDKHFEETAIKALLKREKVVSLADLETALQAKGSSLERERQIFTEQVVAQQWASEKIKGDGKDDESEVTHEDMLAWYQAHLKQFEEQPKARWEELAVSFSRYPSHEAAYSALAALGNRVIAGANFADVAKSGSDGPTASQGGQRDWTHPGSLSADSIDKAIFNLPVGTLSPILESPSGYHIVRVAERKEFTRKSFFDAQKEIKERIQKERFEQKYQDFVKTLRDRYPIWTVFDASLKPEHNSDDDDRYGTH